MIRTGGLTIALLLLGASCASYRAPSLDTFGGANQPVPRGRSYAWTFDDAPQTPGSGESFIPASERRFVASLGRWREERDPAAPSLPNLYRQGGRYELGERPRVVVSELAFGDMTATVKCRPESGAASESCGVMFRLADSDNYLVARADAVNGRIGIFRVIEGAEALVADAPAAVDAWRWHALEVRARGTQVFVRWDGALAVYAHEPFYPGMKIGLATGADAVTAFDDFVVRAD